MFWRHPGHLIWIALAYIPLLGRMSVPLTGDQKVYLSTAMEMREHGSWLRPILFGEGSYYKPPIQYWATLVGWKLFGFNLWGALLPSVFCVLITAWLLGEIAQLLKERRAFVNAGLWFATALGTATYGITAQMEIYVCLFYTASWWAGLKFLSRPIGARDWRWLFIAFLIAGLSALVKSPLYSVFWVAGYLSFLVISGEWELFREKKLYLAWLLGIAAGASWYSIILAVDGKHFWSDYFMRESFEKIGGNASNPFSLWGALLYFCFPFTLMAIPGLVGMWKRRRDANVLRFALCWAWPPALFFTLYPYRIKPYLYILVPMVAVLVDWTYFWIGRSRAFRVAVILSGACGFVVLGGLALILERAELVPPWIWLGLALSGLAALVFAVTDRMRGFALAALAAVFFFRAAAVDLGEADLAGLRLAKHDHPAAAIGMLDENRNIWHEVGLISVAMHGPVARLTNLDQAVEFLQAGGLVALTDEQYRLQGRTIQAKLLGKGDLRNLEEWPWARWKVRAHFPFKELVTQGKAGIPDFDERLKREFKILKVTGA